MSANRAGKREREARNSRKQRCRVTTQLDGVELTLKLGRKKENAFSRSKSVEMRTRNESGGRYTVYDYSSPPHQLAPWAVPVADSRKPVKTDEGDAHVSEPCKSGHPLIEDSKSVTMQADTREFPLAPANKVLPGK
jgi:hypothetical protein